MVERQTKAPEEAKKNALAHVSPAQDSGPTLVSLRVLSLMGVLAMAPVAPISAL
jgi:hypothetical protein